MADQDLKDIFNAASGQLDQADQLQHDNKDLKDIFKAAHDGPGSEEIASQNASQIDQPSILQRGMNAIQNLPQTAVDLIPGMKERREAITAQRASPEYQNAPSAIPGQTQGQMDQSFKDAAENDMNSPDMAAIGAFSPTSALELLPASLSPKLEVMGSKMAQEAMGMNSAKDLTTVYNPMTNSVERGSDIIRGTGTTAIEQGVLDGSPSTWYNNALSALQKTSAKLSPLLQQAQVKLSANLPQVLDQIGGITTKTPGVMQQIFDNIPDSSQQQRIMRVISKQYQNWSPRLEAADGNLQQLNQLKQELTTAAEQLSPAIYGNSPASVPAKAEANLYKRLAGVVRQQIEDLANSAGNALGDQIHQVNKTIGNLQGMLPALQKGTRGGIPTSKSALAQTVLGPIESFAGKALNQTAKTVQTPIGDLVQKAVPSAIKAVAPYNQSMPASAVPVSPWSPSKNKPGNTNQTSSNPQKNPTMTAANLYNATNESLLNVADRLKDQAGLGYTADYLKKAVENDDMDAKNRAIFSLMQSAQARALLTPSEES